jgi:hypothetical protein
MGISDEGYVQDYQAGQRQELFIYCRLCRNTFPVVFKPKPSAQLRCLCGQEAPLSELDVFASQEAATEHASFYEKVYRAAKNALREAGLPVPPSTRIRLSDLHAQSDIIGRSGYVEEDQSDIHASYQEAVEDDDRRSPEAIQEELEDFATRLEETDGDVLEHHEVLVDLVEWGWVRRHLGEDLLGRFLWACQRDIELAPRVIAAAKEQMRSGQKVRLSFNSFKHLAIHFEEEDRLEDAIKVAHLAQRLGLKGYSARMERLQRLLEEE